MNVLEQRPLLSGHLRVGDPPIRPYAGTVAAVNEGPRIAWVVQDVQRPAMDEFRPQKLTFVRPLLQPLGKQKTLVTKRFDDRTGGTGAAECVEEEPQALLHLFVRIEDRPALGVIYKAHGQGTLQFA